MNQKMIEVVGGVEENVVEIQATPIEVSEIAREERQQVCICSTDFN